MFKLLKRMLLLAALSVSWTTWAQDCTQSIPFSEDFESYPGVAYNATSGRILPTCWTGFTTVTNYIPCVVSGTGSYVYTHGGKSMAMTGGSATTYGMNKFVLLPPLEEPLNQLQLSFWMCTEQSSPTYGVLEVGYVTSDDTSTFTSIASFPSSSTTVHSGNGTQASGVGLDVELNLSQVPATATRLAFKWVHSNSSYHTCCIDDVFVDFIPTCPKPLSVAFSDITASSATVSWVPAGSESLWEVVCDGQSFFATDTFYTLSNLDGYTIYDVSVRAICTPGDSSYFVNGSFRTQCEYLETLPYTENFDGITGSTATSGMANILPPCWDYYNDGTRTNYQGCPYVYSSSTYSHSGSNCIRFYSYNSSGDSNQYLILPPVDPDAYLVTDLMVSFWLRGNSTSSTYHNDVVVGVMTNAADESSFVPVTTITSQTTTYEYHEVDLSFYEGPHGRVALLFPKPATSSSYEYGYIDDITLGPLPECPNIQNLAIDSLSVDWAAISWGASENASSWVVEYDTVDFVPGSGDAASTESVSDASLMITDLDTGRTYFVYVRANCGSDTSAYTAITVTTLASTPANVPYFCNFEGNLTDGWTFIQDGQSNYWTVGSATNNGGSRSMYVTDDGTTNNYSGTESYSFATRTFNFTEAGEYAYSYDWKCNGESSFDFLRVAMVPVSTPLTAGSYCGFNNGEAPSGTLPSGGIPLDGQGRLNLNSSWQTVTGTFNISAPGAYNFVFLWRNDGSVYNQPPAAIDNVGLVRNTCPAPINFLVTHSTPDSIVVSWQPVGDESSWIVSNGVDTLVVSDTSYAFDNLLSNTEYALTVSALCGAGDTSLPAFVSARTSCGDITSLPYIESFEGFPSGSSSSLDCGVPCWGRLDNATQYHFGYIGSPSSWPSGGHTGTGFLYYYMPTTAGTYADWILTILPPVDVTSYPLNTLQLSFWVKMNSATTTGDIQVGVLPNINDASTFIPLDTVHVAGDVYDLKTAYLSNYVDTVNAAHIALKYFRNTSTTTYYFVDDVTLDVIPDCPPVSNINVTRATSDSLYISWTEVGDATSWNVEYGAAGFTPGNGTIDVVSTLPYEIGGLSANSAYDIYVTPVCSDGVAATRMGTFRTDCGPTPVPFFENFDTWSSTAADPLPNCWEKHTNYTTNYPYATTTYSHGGSGKSMYMYSTGTTYSYMVLPAFDLPIDSTMLSFWLYKSNTSYAHKLLVGVMTNPADVSTFVQVAEVVPTLSSAWEEFEIPFSSYIGTGTRIAIMSPGNEYSYPYLDDLSVYAISGCQRVVDLTASAVMLDSAIVTWSDGSNTSWYVEYDTVDFTPGSTPGHNLVAVTDTFCILSGLDTGTTYHVYVYPDCDTLVSRQITFTTLASAPATAPYICDFEAAGVNGWDLIQAGQNNYWVVGSATSNGGNKSLYVTDNGTANNYSGSASYSFAVRTFNLQPGNYVCSYDWKCQGESSYDFIRAALVPSGTNIVAGEYCGFNNESAMPAGSIALDGGYRLNLHGSSWQTQVTEFSLSAPGTFKLVFLWRNDGSIYNQPPAAIDNVQLMLNSCPMPDNITLSNLTQTATEVSWQEMGSASSWEYQLDNNSPVVVTDTFCTLSGLSANTVYTFRVRSLCVGDTGMWTTYTFRTPCGYVALPYIEDFENEATGSSSTGSAFVNCWNRLNNGTSYGGYPYVSSSSTYNHTPNGTKGLYWYNSVTANTYGDYQCVVLPPVDPSIGVDSLQVSFWAKASSTTYTPVFQIGVMTDPNNIATFVGVDTVTVTSGTTWMNIEVPLVSYSGTGQYVAVKADRPASSWYAYVDDFILEYIPSCLVPHAVTSTEASMSSITVDWVDLSPASAWEIRYKLNGSNNYTSVVANSHPYTVVGLDTLSSYDFEVRAICTVGDTSRWSTIATLSTEMCDNAFTAATGSPTSTSYYTPVNNYYNYTLTETIIDSAELEGVGDIMAIAYDYSYSSPSTDKNDVKIYLQPTTKSAFSSSSDIELLDTTVAVLVYSGALNCSQGWNYFMLDTTYTWDGHSNLMVIVDDNSSDYNSSSYVFNSSSCSAYKTLVWYSDTENPDPLNSSFSGNMAYYQYRATMKLVSCNGLSCKKPLSPYASDVTYNTATLNWGSLAATDFEVAVKAATEGTWPAEVAVNNATSYDVSNLQPATTYQFRVRAICDAAEALISDWAEGTFTTDSLPCFVPDGFYALETGYTTATFAWNADASQNQWSIRVWNTAGGNDFVVESNPFIATGLTQNTTYFAAIKAICGGGYTESEYSDTIQFTTEQCAKVEGVAVNGVTETSAVVSWTSTGAPKYKVEYGDRNFNQGQGTTVVVEDGATSVTLNNLRINHNYSVFVSAVCEEGAEGFWSDRADFATLDEEGVDVVDGATNLSIYPNPTSDATTIALSGVNGEVTIVIVDMNGRTVATESMSCEGDCTKRMEVSGLAQGAYFVRVNGEGINMVRKLVVK